MNYKTKYLLVPLAFIFLALLVSASSVQTQLFYDSTDSTSYTILQGNSVGIIVDANSALENSMTIKVDLLTSSGSLVKPLIYISNYNDDRYFNYIIIGETEYSNPGNYIINSTVTGASGQSATSILNLEVSESTQGNNPPVIISTPITQINENQQYNYDVDATDADGDALTYSLTQKPSWLSINSQTGLISGTVPNVSSDYQYSVTVKVSDGKDFATQFFTIDAKNIVSPPVNTAPIVQNQSITTDFETPVTITLSATDTEGDALSYLVIHEPLNGDYNFNSNTGIGTYSPDNGFSGSDSFTFKANDGTANSNTATVSIIVNPLPINNPPVLETIGNKEIDESVLLSFVILATDDDSLTFPQPTNLPTGANLTDNTDGTATFSWTPDYTQSGTYDITFIVSDGSLTDSEKITITVNDVIIGNTAPIITTTAVTQIYENQAYSYDVDAIDADGDTLTYSFTENPLGFSIDSTTGLITGTAPSVNQDTTYTVSIEVSDGNGGTDTQTYTLTVNNDGDKDNKKTTTNYYQNNYDEQLYLDQFKPSKIIYLDGDDHPEKVLNWWQKFVAWLAKIFGFN